MTRRRTTTTVALVAAILLALLTAGAALALNYQDYEEITGGTNGNDTLTGTDGDDIWPAPFGEEWPALGDDTIFAEGGDDLVGVDLNPAGDWGTTADPGADTYHGGSGKDILEGRGDGSADTIDCGEGANDLASFDNGPSTSPQTTVSDKVNTENCERLDWTSEHLEDCATKPWDSADVRCKVGNKRGNRLIGTDSPDPNIVDAVWGQRGNDKLLGRRGPDGLEGGKGKDALYGGRGDDALYDSLSPDTYPDKLYGGDGDDRIDATDNENGDWDAESKPDTISCGAGGHDWVVVDGIFHESEQRWEGIDEDPLGVKITQDGQAGCEAIQFETTGWKSWWKFWRRR